MNTTAEIKKEKEQQASRKSRVKASCEKAKKMYGKGLDELSKR
ncbi:hypothetical protein QUF84_24650 [Fictibacillus enclensis]|nr:hypothetical protein [Fictibacillus enclensis]MDM5340389.1 hypothetical protein [Fictibacillus enclensis]